MPDGKTHRKIHGRCWLLPIVSAGLLYRYVLPETFGSVIMSLFIPVGYWLGRYIDPDLDLPRQTAAEKLWRKTIILTPILLWWWLYAVLAKAAGGHRSFLTHAPFISTAIRFVWILAPFIIIAYLSGLFTTKFSDLSLALLAGIYLGLGVADTVHTLADLIL